MSIHLVFLISPLTSIAFLPDALLELLAPSVPSLGLSHTTPPPYAQGDAPSPVSLHLHPARPFLCWPSGPFPLTCQDGRISYLYHSLPALLGKREDNIGWFKILRTRETIDQRVPAGLA